MNTKEKSKYDIKRRMEVENVVENGNNKENNKENDDKESNNSGIGMTWFYLICLKASSLLGGFRTHVLL